MRHEVYAQPFSSGTYGSFNLYHRMSYNDDMTDLIGTPVQIAEFGANITPTDLQLTLRDDGQMRVILTTMNMEAGNAYPYAQWAYYSSTNGQSWEPLVTMAD